MLLLQDLPSRKYKFKRSLLFYLLVVTCGDPGSVQNAQRQVINFNVGSRATYTCTNCYIGGGALTCQGNGQWSQPRPTCNCE